MTHFPHGAYRRRIRLVLTEGGGFDADDDGGVVEGGLEDDFHYFKVRLTHDRSVVTDVSARAIRWPWTTCPDAVDPLRSLTGMELSPRCLAVGDAADPKMHCTHMFDLAGLCVAHAARGGPVGTTRQYDVEIPHLAQGREPAVVRVWRDHELVHQWTLDGRSCVHPSPFDEAPWKGGFFRWAERTLHLDDAEAAIVLRRACDIGMGRGMDLDAVDRADEMERLMAGVCFTMQPSQIRVALRHKETVRDFHDRLDAMLADGPAPGDPGSGDRRSGDPGSGDPGSAGS